jgi:methionyl-tRNA formyltransferase
MGLSIVFMGTPEFAVASLDKLINEDYNIAAVVTAADKPAGRGQKIQWSSVKKYAVEKQIPILQPEKLKDSHFAEQLKQINADIFIVVAFRMLPEEIWSMPRLGTINLHASLLPQYRGAAPINWAIINGESESGVTTFMIEKDIDTGKILLSEKVSIGLEDDAGDLHDKLMNSGAILLAKTVKGLESGTLKPFSQNDLLKSHTEIKLAPKLFRENCRINWNQESKKIYDHIRGLSPFPAAWSILQNSKNKQQTTVKIFKTQIQNDPEKEPGTITSDGKTFMNIASADGCISLKEFQLEGKKRLDVSEFLRGFREIEEYKFIN